MNLEQYSDEFSFTESPELQKVVYLSDKELQYADMISGKQVAGLLRTLISIGKYKRVLEVGMFTGYATLAMAEVLPDDGEITTLEMNTRYLNIAERCFADSPHHHKINIVFGNARENVKKLTGKFDLIFLDADKQFYPEYFKILDKHLATGGLLVADNVFWHGKVLELNDRKSIAINEMSRLFKENEDYETVMLTVRDGLLIARKR